MDKKVRAPHLWEIIVALLLLVVVLSIAIGVLNVDTYGPFILVIAFTSVMAMRMGLGWKEIQQAILSSLQSVLQALLILIMVGMVISTWDSRRYCTIVNLLWVKNDPSEYIFGNDFSGMQHLRSCHGKFLDNHWNIGNRCYWNQPRNRNPCLYYGRDCGVSGLFWG